MDYVSVVMSAEIGRRLRARGKTVGTAESCTGGTVAATFTTVPGASDYFKGAVVAYTNDVKERVLGVPHSVIEAQTAVCEDVAVAMVRGACRTLRCDYAVSVTGVAGPGGGTPDIPVGTIWIACGTAERVRTLRLDGDRGRTVNVTVAAYKAIELLADCLDDEP